MITPAARQPSRWRDLLFGSKWRTLALGFAITVPFFVLLLSTLDLGTMRSVLEHARFELVVAGMGAFVVCIGIQAIRWRLLIRRLGDVSLWTLYRVMLIGQMGNVLLPLRGGDIVRVAVVGQVAPLSRMSILGTIIVERVSDGCVLLLLLGGFLVVHGASHWLTDVAVGAAAVFGMGALAIAALIASPRLMHGVLDRAPVRVKGLVLPLLESLVAGLRTIDSPGVLLLVLFWTAAFWLSLVGIYWLEGVAFGLHGGIAVYLLVTATGNLSLSVPSSQGGLGPFELSVRQALVFLGITAESATAYALGLHAVLIVPVIVAGVVSAWSLDMPLGDLWSQRLIEPEPLPTEV